MKSQAVPVTITGATANSSGLGFSRLSVGAPVTWPVAGIGVDSTGTVVVTDAGFRAVSVSDVANPGNSTADTQVLAVTIPANALTAGTSGNIRAFGSANVAGAASFNLWVKLGTTKVLSATYGAALLGAITNGGVMLNAYFTIRSAGTSGSVVFSGHGECIGAVNQTVVGSTIQAVNTTLAQTLSMGFNWNNGANANVVTINQCIIGPI